MNEDQINNKRIILYDVLKFFAIILVLIGHSTYVAIITKYGGVSYECTGDYSVFYKIVSKLVGIIYIFHMPLFIAISGALFYRECNKINFSFENLLQKKFKTLIIPYISYGIIYTVTVKFIAGYYNLTDLPYQIIYGTLFGQDTTQHIWFLPTLFIITVMFYVFAVCGLKKKEKIIGILLVVMSIFYTQITVVFPGVKYFTKLFIFFGVGFLFEKYRENVETINNKKSLLYIIIALIATIMLLKLYHCIDIELIRNFVEIILILGFLVIFLLLSIIISRIPYLVNNKLFKMVGKYAFGIYILADPLNYIVLNAITQLNLISAYTTNLGSILTIIIRTIGNMTLSILIVKFIDKLKEKENFNKCIKIILALVISVSMIIIIFSNIIGVQPIIYKI